VACIPHSSILDQAATPAHKALSHGQSWSLPSPTSHKKGHHFFHSSEGQGGPGNFMSIYPFGQHE